MKWSRQNFPIVLGARILRGARSDGARSTTIPLLFFEIHNMCVAIAVSTSCVDCASIATS